jgi:hypothetical protein
MRGVRRSRLAAVALTLVLAACGDDEGSGAMTVADYRAAAAKICRDSHREANQLGGATRTPKAYAQQLEELLALNAKTRERLAALDPPEHLRAAHDEVLRTNDQGAAYIRTIIDRLERAKTTREVFDNATGRRIRELDRQSDDAARRLGVPVCAED